LSSKAIKDALEMKKEIEEDRELKKEKRRREKVEKIFK
jgi:hypothetical protein